MMDEKMKEAICQSLARRVSYDLVKVIQAMGLQTTDLIYMYGLMMIPAMVAMTVDIEDDKAKEWMDEYVRLLVESAMESRADMRKTETFQELMGAKNDR